MSRVLVVYWWPAGRPMRLAVAQHLRALERPGAQVVYHNARERVPRWLQRVRLDGVVLHTTFLCTRWYSNFEAYQRRFRWLADVDGPTVALPQDEYDHCEVLDEWLASIGTTHVFSNFGPDNRATLYPTLGTRAEFTQVLTGYIDENAARPTSQRLLPGNRRPHDVVYRAAQLPFWFGSHGQLKHRIGAAAQSASASLGLRADISTDAEHTIFGERWLDFLMSGRAIVGAESGSSVLDRRGEVRRAILELLASQPDLTFEQVSARMPPGWDDYAFTALSPRHLEAVVTKTCQVLVEGEYNGVLEAGRHYLPVRRDLSDLEDAMRRLQDTDLVRSITEDAYHDVYRSGRYTYAVLADAVWDALGGAARRRRATDKLIGGALSARTLRKRSLQRVGLEIVRASRASNPAGRALLRAVDAYRVSREPANDLRLRTIVLRSAARTLLRSGRGDTRPKRQ